MPQADIETSQCVEVCERGGLACRVRERDLPAGARRSAISSKRRGRTLCALDRYAKPLKIASPVAEIRIEVQLARVIPRYRACEVKR